MQQSGAFMHENLHGSRQSYKGGCRCDLCKQAESQYKRDLRRRQREAVGEFVTRDVTLSLVPGGSGAANVRAVYTGGPVESAVSLEIEELGAHQRPGLAAAAFAMARILDNPKAVSSQPPAARMLSTLLDKLRSASAGRHRGNLAVVRAMTTNGGAPTVLDGPSGTREQWMPRHEPAGGMGHLYSPL